MPTPRSLLHLNGANGSTTVTNAVTGASAIAWAFQNAGAGLTTSSPYLGSAMALLNKNSFLNSAAITPTGDWTLAFRIGITNNSDNGQFAFLSQGKAGDAGHWALVLGDDNNIYFFTNSGDIDGALSGGNAGAVVTKMKAGNAFCVFQWIGGVLSFGMAGAGETSVTRLLSGAFNGGGSPAGAFHFNGRFDPTGVAYANSGTSRVDEVVFQDGGAIWPTYPFATPTTEYAFGVAITGSVVDASDVLMATAPVGIRVSGTVQDRGDLASGAATALTAVAATVRDVPDVVQATAQVGATVQAVATEAPDVVQATVQVGATVQAVATDSPDAVQASAIAVVTTAGMAVDRGDVVQASALLGIAAAGIAVDPPDVVQGLAKTAVSVTGVAIDAADTVQAASSALASANASLVDVSDVATGVAALEIATAASLIDADDLAAGAVALSTGAAAAILDAADVAWAAVAAGVRLSVDVQDAADQVVASAQAALVAAGAIADSPDVVAGQAFVGARPVAVVGAAVDASDMLAAVAKLPTSVAGLVHDFPDLVIAQAVATRPAVPAAASIRDASDLVAGRAVVSIAAMFARTDASDICIASAAAAVRVNATVVDDNDSAIGSAVNIQLPVAHVAGAVYDTSDWLQAFARSGPNVYGAQSSRRRQAGSGQRPATVFSTRTVVPMRTRPRNVQGRD